MSCPRRDGYLESKGKHTPTMAVTSVRFISYTRHGEADPCGLEPAPSVRNWEEIAAGLEGVEPITSVDKLLMGPHKIRGSYRGWNMYLYPNVRFYRNEPKTSGGNGLAGWPSVGMQEKVTLRCDNVIFDAEVEYV